MIDLPSASAVVDPLLSSAAQARASATSVAEDTLVIGDAQGKRLVGIHLAPREDQLLCHRKAHATRQKIHTATIGDNAAIDIRPGIAGVFTFNDEIAGKRRNRTQTRSRAIDYGDRWLRHIVQ